MHLLPLFSALFMKLEMVVLQHGASFEYISWVNAFIPATLCAFQKVASASYSTRRIVGIFRLASTRFSVSPAPSASYQD